MPIHNQLPLAPDELPAVDLIAGKEALRQIIEYYTFRFRPNQLALRSLVDPLLQQFPRHRVIVRLRAFSMLLAAI
jgi:hypothetical protein